MDVQYETIVEVVALVDWAAHVGSVKEMELEDGWSRGSSVVSQLLTQQSVLLL